MSNAEVHKHVFNRTGKEGLISEQLRSTILDIYVLYYECKISIYHMVPCSRSQIQGEKHVWKVNG